MTIDLIGSILKNKKAWHGEASLVCKLWDHDGNLTSWEIPNVPCSLCPSRVPKKSFFFPSETWELFWILASPRLWLFSHSFLFLWTVIWEGWMENNQESLLRFWNIMTSGFPYSQCLTAHDNIICKFFYNIPGSHINDNYPQTISKVD